MFQHTRRLISAVWQRIVYEEYLQPILGFNIFRQFNLNSDTPYGNELRNYPSPGREGVKRGDFLLLLQLNYPI